MRVVLVHNKKAGTGEHNRRSLAERIGDAGHEVSCYAKSDPAWRSAIDGSVELVAVAGGDGTVGTVVRALAGSHTPIAVLPLGTANNISRALGLADTSLPELISGWSDAAVRPVDVGVARGPWGTLRFVESTGAGLLAEGMADIDEGNSRPVNDLEDPEARLTTATDVLRRMLATLDAREFDVTIDGTRQSGRYLLIEVLNLGTAGPNLRLAPHADPSDGLFDVVLADEPMRRMLIEQLPTFRLDPYAAPALHARRARHVSIACGNFRVHVDDEVCQGECEVVEPIRIDLSVEPGAIRFLVPPGA